MHSVCSAVRLHEMGPERSAFELAPTIRRDLAKVLWWPNRTKFASLSGARNTQQVMYQQVVLDLLVKYEEHTRASLVRTTHTSRECIAYAHR
jgi:hypothetical protein